MDHLNETLADDGFHYTVQTWQPPKPEAHETEPEPWGRENQLDDYPFCPENWPNLYMMALPIYIGPHGMGRGNAVMAIGQEAYPPCRKSEQIRDILRDGSGHRISPGRRVSKVRLSRGVSKDCLGDCHEQPVVGQLESPD